MPRYRFTKEDFYFDVEVLRRGVTSKDMCDRANSILEQMENESEKVFGVPDPIHFDSEWFTVPGINSSGEWDTHQAILWNPQPIKNTDYINDTYWHPDETGEKK